MAMANDGDDGQPNTLIITHPEPSKLNSTQLSCGVAVVVVAVVVVTAAVANTKAN